MSRNEASERETGLPSMLTGVLTTCPNWLLPQHQPRCWSSPLDIDPVKLPARLLARAPDWVIENRQPVRVVGTAEFAEKKYLLSESVDLPLSLDGDRVDRILIIAVYRFVRLERNPDA